MRTISQISPMSPCYVRTFRMREETRARASSKCLLEVAWDFGDTDSGQAMEGPPRTGGGKRLFLPRRAPQNLAAAMWTQGSH